MQATQHVVFTIPEAINSDNQTDTVTPSPFSAAAELTSKAPKARSGVLEAKPRCDLSGSRRMDAMCNVGDGFTFTGCVIYFHESGSSILSFGGPLIRRCYILFEYKQCSEPSRAGVLD